MALSYNFAYQEIISVHPTRRQIFAANHTLLSGTSENESYISACSVGKKTYCTNSTLCTGVAVAHDM